MFKGVTDEGINREVSSTLECARLNREHRLQSLAIPETSLLFLAKEKITTHQLEAKINASNPRFKMNIPRRQRKSERSEPDAKTVLRGILPSLEYLVGRSQALVKFSQTWEQKTKSAKHSWRVSIDSKPNAWQNPLTFPLDP